MANRRRLQPLDRLALSLITGLSLVIGIMLLVGDQAAAQVRDFSWQNQRIGREDIAFILSFSRPMDPKSVEQNLLITPPLPGKFSWAGQRMAYTLNAPAPYGETFEIRLDQAQDRFRQKRSRFQPFKEQFKSRDRAFAYIGIEGKNQGRLVLYNLTQQTETPLTPEDWVVLDFQPYPQGDRILFSATDYKSYQQNTQNQKLYTVTTGLESPSRPQPRWKFWQTPAPLTQPQAASVTEIQEILTSEQYQNFKFDLSADGKVIVVQRVSRKNPNDFGPWVLTEGDPPRRLETQPGGDFMITPDSQSLLLQQGEGTAVIALTAPEITDEGSSTANTQAKTLDFLPEYGLVLDIASNGSAAAMVSFNQNDPTQRYTQTLFWVSNQNQEKPLITATGSILDAQFDPNNELLYCLLSRLLPGETYQVQPYLVAANVKTGKLYELLAMPPQPSVNMSLAPDGLAVLFDETVAAETEAAPIRATDGREIATGRLWLLPLFQTIESRLAQEPTPTQPQELPFSGLHPIWLP